MHRAAVRFDATSASCILMEPGVARVVAGSKSYVRKSAAPVALKPVAMWLLVGSFLFTAAARHAPQMSFYRHLLRGAISWGWDCRLRNILRASPSRLSSVSPLRLALSSLMLDRSGRAAAAAPSPFHSFRYDGLSVFCQYPFAALKSATKRAMLPINAWYQYFYPKNYFACITVLRAHLTKFPAAVTKLEPLGLVYRT